MIALACSALLAARGLRKGSLSPGGAATAALVGFLHMASSFECGATLIAFYLASSKLTKWRSELKARLEAEHSVGGRRGAAQVLANSLLGAALAVAAAWLRATSVPTTAGSGGGMTSTATAASTGATASLLTCAFVGFYACCCADTWSSEVGIASGSPPRLVTTGRRVPPGTNGAVSLLGTAAAAAGGAFVGSVYCVAARLPGLLLSLNNGSSTRGGGGGGGGAAPCWRLVLLALAAGVAGSLLDSLLGATLQWSGWDERSGKAVSGRPAAGDGGGGVKHVCGRDVLSNTGVNVVSSLLTTLLAAALGPGWLGAGAATR